MPSNCILVCFGGPPIWRALSRVHPPHPSTLAQMSHLPRSRHPQGPLCAPHPGASMCTYLYSSSELLHFKVLRPGAKSLSRPVWTSQGRDAEAVLTVSHGFRGSLKSYLSPCLEEMSSVSSVPVTITLLLGEAFVFWCLVNRPTFHPRVTCLHCVHLTLKELL